MAIDFNKPVLTDVWVTLLDTIKNNIIQSAVLFADGTGDNIPDGAVRLNKSTMKFEQWTGSPAAWAEMTITGAVPDAHALIDTTGHTVSGLTAGHYIRATGATTYSFGAIQAADVPTLNQNTTGNAATATALANTRTIWGNDFNGSANVSGLLSGPGSIELTGEFGGAGEFDIALSGAGTRMIWNPKKAAFRAGYVTGTQWDNANVGPYSTAMGGNTTASGNYSTAMGYNTTASVEFSTAIGRGTTASGSVSTALGYGTTASGNYSTALGEGANASGSVSTALGYETIASGQYSTAMGYSTTSSGDYSTAMGRGTTASGGQSTAMGFVTTASGKHSTAMGYNTTASGVASTAMGSFTKAESYLGVAIGQYNVGGGTPGSWDPADPIFEIGNGEPGSLSNSTTIYKNGNINTIGTITADALSLTTDLAVEHGGTGLSSLAAGRIPYGAVASPFGNSGEFSIDFTNNRFLIGRSAVDSTKSTEMTMQFGGNSILSSTKAKGAGGLSRYAQNYFVDTSGQARYISSDYATMILQYRGDIRFYVAPSGTAGDVATMTEVVRVSNNNYVGIGTTAPAKKLEVQDATGAQARLTHSSGNYTDFQTDGDGNLTIAPSGGVKKTIANVFTKRNTSTTSHKIFKAGSSVSTIQRLIAVTVPASGGLGIIRIRWIVTRDSISTGYYEYYFGRIANQEISLGKNSGMGAYGQVSSGTFNGGTYECPAGLSDTSVIQRTGTEADTDPQQFEITINARGSATGHTGSYAAEIEIFTFNSNFDVLTIE